MNEKVLAAISEIFLRLEGRFSDLELLAGAVSIAYLMVKRVEAPEKLTMHEIEILKDADKNLKFLK